MKSVFVSGSCSEQLTSMMLISQYARLHEEQGNFSKLQTYQCALFKHHSCVMNCDTLFCYVQFDLNE